MGDPVDKIIQEALDGSFEKEIAAQNELVAKIAPMLRDIAPDVVGGSLGELTSIWLAGHAPDIRAAAAAQHFEYIRLMAESYASEVWGPDGKLKH